MSKIDFAKVHADIVREFSAEPSAWDSDFLLKATPDEMVAYVLHFHGLAPDFRTAHDWVYRFAGWVDGFSYGDEFFDEFWNLPIDMQANLFAHLCISIGVQGVNE